MIGTLCTAEGISRNSHRHLPLKTGVQSPRYESFDIISWESSIQKDVGTPASGRFLRFGADCIDRCTAVMRYFVDKFPDGYEGWAQERGEEPVLRD